jgi:dihydroxyacid dehydratase/phosphogluconate dehydratase
MDTTTRAGSPLRQRMIEDMRMRKLEPKTQEAYIRAFRNGFDRRGQVTVLTGSLHQELPRQDSSCIGRQVV